MSSIQQLKQALADGVYDKALVRLYCRPISQASLSEPSKDKKRFSDSLGAVISKSMQQVKAKILSVKAACKHCLRYDQDAERAKHSFKLSNPEFIF